MYQIPVSDDTRPILFNTNTYSLFDLKEGFYYCELDTESFKLCTFSILYESFSFKHLLWIINTTRNFSNVNG